MPWKAFLSLLWRAIVLSAYFKSKSIISKTEGTATYIRDSDAGKKLEFHFCSNCASTVWYEPEFMPGFTAVAVGCFGDPDFPSPQLYVWSPTKHPWVRFPPSSIPFKRQPSDIITSITLHGKLSRPYYWKDYLLGTFRKRKHRIRPDEEVCCLWREDLVDLISR